MNLDIGKAFTFPMEDQRWVAKLAIGGGLLLAGFITLIGWIFTVPVVLGYLVNLTRNVINGHPQPLPEWDNWGERWIEGFKAGVVAFVYYLPFGIVAFIFGIPGGVLQASSNSGLAALGATLSLAVNVCIAPLLGFLLAIILPVVIARYAVAGNMGDAFKFGEIVATVRQNIGTYFIVALLSTIVAWVLGGIGLIACLVGAFFTTFYAYLMTYHLYGQAYRNTQGATFGYSQPPMYGEPRPF
jgi:hypothetical protein